MNRILLLAQLVVIVVLAVFHLTALEFYLYWHFVWLDIVTHALGGMWIGILVLMIRAWLGYTPSIVWGVFGAIVLGGLWEVFDAFVGVPWGANDALDTSIDLLMDAVGGAFGALFAQNVLKRQVPKLE